MDGPPPAKPQPPIPEKRSWSLVASLLILIYGGLVTFGLMVLIEVGNAFNFRGHVPQTPPNTPLSDAWPAVAWYVFSAAGPHIPGSLRLMVFIVGLPLLLAICFAVFGEEALPIAGIIAGSSLLVWLPLLARHDRTEQNE
jgi:hypothetical protein